jgi:hypothetical protein
MPNEKISKLYAALTKPRDEFNGSPLVSTEKLGNNIAEFESKLQDSAFKDKLFKVITKPRDEFGGSPFLSEAKVGKSVVEFDSLFSLSQKKNPIGSESTSGFAPSLPIKQSISPKENVSPVIQKNEGRFGILSKAEEKANKSIYASAKPGLLRLEQAQQQLSEIDKEIRKIPEAISFDQLSKTSVGNIDNEKPILYGNVSGFNQAPPKQVSNKDLEFIQKSRVEDIKRQRQQLYTNVKANIKQTQPQIQKIVESAIKTNGVDYFTKTVDGDKSPSESTISNWTSKNIDKLGLTDESYVNDLIKREISANVSYKLIEPKINKEFTDNFKKEFNKTPDQAVREDFEKGFGALAKIKLEKDVKIKGIENDIKTQAKDEISTVSNEYKTKFNDFNNNYKTSITALQTKSEQLNESYKTGKLDEQNYKLQFDQLKQQEGSLNEEYKTGFKTVADNFLRNQNAINARFDQRYRRQVDEVNKIATDKLQVAGEEYSKKYKMSPELKARYEKIYKDSVDNVTKREDLAAYTKERIEGFSTTLGKSLASGFGTGVQQLAGFVDWDLGQTWGKDLESAFSLSNADINKPSDLLDLIKLARSTGQTVGAMAPMLAGNALIAMSTGGMSIPAQLAIQGGFGYLMETAQMASGAYDQKLEQSGIVAEAEKAANTVIKGNTLLLPLYALDGLPFIEGVSLGIKNRFLRGIAKGGIETVTEITQEVPQTAIEDLAQAGKGLDGLLSKLNLGNANNRAEIGHTIMNVIPTSLAMGSSPTFLGYAKKPYNFVLGMTTSAKNTIKDIEGSAAKKQFIFDTFATKGESFTKGMLHSMYSSGLVNETELSEMKSILDTSKDLQEKSDKLKLTKPQSKIYSALSFNLNNAKAEFESMTEGIEKDALGKKVKELESNLTNFINNKQANYAVITLPNKEQYVYTINGVLDYIKNNPALIKAIKENKLNLTVVSNKNDQFAQELDAIISPANEEAKTNPIEVDLAAEAEVEDVIPSIEGVKTPLLQESTKQEPITGEQPTTNIEQKRVETENKIKRKDLFDGVGEFSKLGGSEKTAVPTSHKEISGIEFVEYSNPDTGSVDVIVTGKSDNDFVGFYRIYENGKPTNKWSSKFENQSRNKEDFKTMISGVQEMLPKNHEYTETTSISTDGLRVWNQQLRKGYELQYDENGKLKTNLVAINGDAIVNDLGVEVDKGNFENIKIKSKEEFEKVKEKLLPYLEKLGLNEKNIYWYSGTVKIDLPVLKKSETTTKPTEDATKISTKPVTQGGEQGSIVQREGTQEGQPQAGQREGGTGETTQPEANNSNRPISSEEGEKVTDINANFAKITELFQKSQEVTGVEKTRINRERQALLNANPSVKYIWANMSKIEKQLGERFTKKGNCP